MPQKRRKRQRRGDSTVPGDRLRAERPDHVWALDFQFDVTDDGRALKLLYVVDEFTREALAMEAERRIDADNVVDVLDRIVAERGTPPGVRALRQRAGDDLQRAARLVPLQPDRRGVHRARLPVGEPVRGVVQQPRPRRAARRRGVLLPGRGEGDGRGLPPGLQPLPATPSARDDDPRGVRRPAGGPPTRPRPPAPNSAAATRSLRSTPAAALPCRYLPPTSSHSRWTHEWGPAKELGYVRGLPFGVAGREQAERLSVHLGDGCGESGGDHRLLVFLECS